MLSAFILCAGKNSRIQKYNKNIIKPLIIYNNKTLLEHHLEKIEKLKIYLKNINIFINVAKNYLNFEKLISRKKIIIKVIKEKKILGTAGVIVTNIKKLNNDVLVLYGDNYLNVDIKRFVEFFYKKNCDLLMGVFLKKDLSDSGLVIFDHTNKIRKIDEKNKKNKSLTRYCNSGLYLIKKKILKNFSKKKYLDFSHDVLPVIIKNNNSYIYKIGFCKSFDDEKNYKKNVKK